MRLNEEMLAWEISKWLHFQPVSQPGYFFRFYLLSAGCGRRCFSAVMVQTSAVAFVTRDVGVPSVTQRDMKRVW